MKRMPFFTFLLAVLLAGCSNRSHTPKRARIQRPAGPQKPVNPPAGPAEPEMDFPENEVPTDFSRLAAPYVDRFTPDPSFDFAKWPHPPDTPELHTACIGRPVETQSLYVRSQSVYPDLQPSYAVNDRTTVRKLGPDSLRIVIEDEGVGKTNDYVAVYKTGEGLPETRKNMDSKGGVPTDFSMHSCKVADTAYDSHWRAVNGRLKLADGTEVRVRRASYSFKGNALCTQGEGGNPRRFRGVTVTYVLFIAAGFGSADDPCGPFSWPVIHEEIRAEDGTVLELRHEEITGRRTLDREIR